MREWIRVGVAVSIGAQRIKHDDDPDLRIRRHRLIELEHVAVLKRGQYPGFRGITPMA